MKGQMLDFLKRRSSRIKFTNKELKNANFSIGAWTYGIPKVRFPDSGAKLTIGRFCSIADRVQILLGGHHPTDWVTTYPFHQIPAWASDLRVDASTSTKGDVSIGNDVWIGSQATILSGVTIGDGAVIGAGAVISRDVPAYGIAVGNPARIARFRFDPVTIDRLLALAWWDMPVDVLKPLLPLLLSNDIAAFLDRAEEAKKHQ